MLRIFDPMEMYGVIETLQGTVQQLEQEKAELLKLVNLEGRQRAEGRRSKKDLK